MAGVRKLRSGTWQGWYQHYEGRRAFFTLTRAATKREVLTAAQALEVQHAQMRLGVLPRPDQQHAALSRPIGEMIEAYLTWGKFQGGSGGRPWSAKHLNARTKQLTQWRTELHLTTLGQCLDILPSVERLLHEKIDRGLASQTHKHMRAALMAFLAWCVKRHYLPRHPLTSLTPIPVMRVSERRLLTISEIHRLLAACLPSHRLLYITALLSGLRANELRQLSLDHLDVEAGGLRLEAAWTKNRRPGLQPLPGELLADLYASGRAGIPVAQYAKTQGYHVYPPRPLLFVPHHTSRLINNDLRRAGIPKHTPQGKIDFHALRTTYINLMFARGATPPEAQALARHSTAELTIGVYGRAYDTRLSALVEDAYTTIVPQRQRAPGVHAQAIGHEQSLQNAAETDMRRQPSRRAPALHVLPPDAALSPPLIPSVPQIQHGNQGAPAAMPQTNLSVPHALCALWRGRDTCAFSGYAESCLTLSYPLSHSVGL